MMGCAVIVSLLAFGLYDPNSAAPLDSVATVSSQCGSPARVALAGGSERRLRSDRAAIRYTLYLDPARTRPWGDGTGASTLLEIPSGRSATTVFGRIHARQNLPPGAYSDSVVVIVQF
jgi:spore coat protein U-like protein